MDELVKLVSEKTGLPEQQAKIAVETVVNFLKDKLPAPIAGRLDDVLSGADITEGLGDLAEGLGSLLGKK